MKYIDDLENLNQELHYNQELLEDKNNRITEKIKNYDIGIRLRRRRIDKERTDIWARNQSIK